MPTCNRLVRKRTDDVHASGRLEHQTAFVTGAGSGIGRATAELFAAQGAVVGVADVNQAGAAVTVDSIGLVGGHAEAYGVDVADPEAVREAIAAFVAAHGSIDILVNNAGVVVAGAAAGLSDSDWQRNLDVNLAGAFYCCREALVAMVRQRSGSIVSVSSTSAFHPVGERAAYAAAKAGIYGLMRSIALDYASSGIRANAVAPGAIATPLLLEGRVKDPRVRRAALRAIPMKRFGEPAEIARAILFLASNEASYITGHLLVVDGGATV
jgi:NAD(P)-dependent dehydrogenase (short-subunit alcohol dehydrogenase family)